MVRMHLFKMYSYNICSYGSYRSDLYNMHSISIQRTNGDTCAYKIGTIQSPYIISSSKYMNQYLVHASKKRSNLTKTPFFNLPHDPNTKTTRNRPLPLPSKRRGNRIALVDLTTNLQKTWSRWHLGHKQYHLSFLTLKSIRTITSEEPKICYKSFHVSQEM